MATDLQLGMRIDPTLFQAPVDSAPSQEEVVTADPTMSFQAAAFQAYMAPEVKPEDVHVEVDPSVGLDPDQKIPSFRSDNQTAAFLDKTATVGYEMPPNTSIFGECLGQACKAMSNTSEVQATLVANIAPSASQQETQDFQNTFTPVYEMKSSMTI